MAELTLTQDLRNLIGTLPDADRREWFERYGRETGPLNAKGFLITLDARPLDLRFRGFELAVEEHPRYTFHFEAPLPERGRLKVQDTNFVASEGTSRLGVRARDGVSVESDDLAPDVEQIPTRPVWQLSDAEERRTKQVDVAFRSLPAAPSHAVVNANVPQSLAPEIRRAPPARLSGLLERAAGLSLVGLSLIAFGLGAAHAVQPGHGKTLVAATVLGDRGQWLRGVLLAVVITVTHTGSVMLVAAALWVTRSTRYESINTALTHCAGFLIAAIGLWRLGRHLAGYGEHDETAGHETPPSARGVIGLGMAGGLVPCWDAVGLIVLAESIGRLGLGMLLLIAFGLGMASVLIAVGWIAGRFRTSLSARPDSTVWEHRLGVASGVALFAIGVYLLA